MDFILQKFFEQDRWQYAIDKGLGKDMDKATLRYLMSPNGRESMLDELLNGTYTIQRPWTAKIPKDTPGEYRTVFVNNAKDRIFLSIANDLLFELTKGVMIHHTCMSYQQGIGCGKVVQRMVKNMMQCEDAVIGYKSDLSKYFDSVPREYIMRQFDAVEAIYGHSVIIDVLRNYYNLDLYWDSELKCEVKQYQSLKQGCAVASWLADVVLYPLDKMLSEMDVVYYRYSDDMSIIGPEREQAMQVLKAYLADMQMKLNPKKVEPLTKTKWFKFLGFALKGTDISLSKGRLQRFEESIRSVTTDLIREGVTYEKALRGVYRVLYNPSGDYSWASAVLPIMTNQHDINRLNGFVMDCLRAVQTGKDSLYGLGWNYQQKDGVVQCGKGRNVKVNRMKIPQLQGYVTIGCMQRAIHTSMAAYRTKLATMMAEQKWLTDGEVQEEPVTLQDIDAAYQAYKYSIPNAGSDRIRYPYFMAVSIEQLNDEQMLYGENRNDALSRLQMLVRSALKQNAIPFKDGWFYESEADRDLVILNPAA